MDEKLYKYMDWPRIEAVVYGEEVSPKDVMGPRITKDGVLIQGFFPEAKSAKVIAGKKEYQMEMEDEAGYFAGFRNTAFLCSGKIMKSNGRIRISIQDRCFRKKRRLFVQGYIMSHIKSWELIL